MKIICIDYFKIYLLSATMKTPGTNTISSLRAYENVRQGHLIFQSIFHSSNVKL